MRSACSETTLFEASRDALDCLIGGELRIDVRGHATCRGREPSPEHGGRCEESGELCAREIPPMGTSKCDGSRAEGWASTFSLCKDVAKVLRPRQASPYRMWHHGLRLRRDPTLARRVRPAPTGPPPSGDRAAASVAVKAPERKRRARPDGRARRGTDARENTNRSTRISGARANPRALRRLGRRREGRRGDGLERLPIEIVAGLTSLRQVFPQQQCAGSRSRCTSRDPSGSPSGRPP